MIGVEHDRLRRLTLPTLARAAFDRLVADLQAAGRLAQTGGWLHLPAHARHAGGDATSSYGSGCGPLLDAAPFQPPRVRDVARASGIDEEAVRGLMKRAGARRRRLSGRPRPLLHGARPWRSSRGKSTPMRAATVPRVPPALRDAIGGGRKVAIHILEFFDRVGYTRRVGDVHVRRAAGHDAAMGSGNKRRRSSPGGAAGLQNRQGPPSGPWWVRLPLSSAKLSQLSRRHRLAHERAKDLHVVSPAP